jgi:hypothetical protein
LFKPKFLFLHGSAYFVYHQTASPACFDELSLNSGQN